MVYPFYDIKEQLVWFPKASPRALNPFIPTCSPISHSLVYLNPHVLSDQPGLQRTSGLMASQQVATTLDRAT